MEIPMFVFEYFHNAIYLYSRISVLLYSYIIVFRVNLNIFSGFIKNNVYLCSINV